MTVVANFSVPYTDFALGTLLEVREGIHVRLESMIPTSEAVMPYFWVSAADADEVERVLAADPLTERVDVVDELDGEKLFRVEWADDIDGLIDSILTADAVVLHAEGMGDAWNFQLRFTDYDALSAFYRDCVHKGVSLDLDRIHDSVGGDDREGYGLTPEQRETLQTALATGYFDVPRETTLVELAERLGVSDSAVSQRLRRGLTSLLERTLIQES